MASQQASYSGRGLLWRGFKAAFFMGLGAGLQFRSAESKPEAELMRAYRQANGIAFARQFELISGGRGLNAAETAEGKSKQQILAGAEQQLKASQLQVAGFVRLQACEVLDVAKNLAGSEKEKASLEEQKQRALAKGLSAIASSGMLRIALDELPGAPASKGGDFAKILGSVDALQIRWSFGIRPSLASPPTPGEHGDKLKWVPFRDNIYSGFRTGKPLADEERKELGKQIEKPATVPVYEVD